MKALKIIGIIAAVAAFAVGVYFLITKVILKKKDEAAADEAEIESFVSCSCVEDEPIVIPEAVAEAV
ncbi:MAG: hypothetical protein LBR73_00670 [Oscillospiraceae bacterium]|jgi:hypothetical protein|nr:hypothetical protein [Oscillospiraceae bacterium]